MHADFGFTLGTANGNRSYVPMPLNELGDLKHMENSIALDVLAKPGIGGPNLGNVSTDAGTRVSPLIATNATIRYGDQLIGPGGSIVPRGLR